MKVLITNTVALNGGDAAILLSVIEMLQSEFGSDTQVIVFGSQPEDVMNCYPELDVRGPLYRNWATRRQQARLTLVLWLWNLGHPGAAARVAGAKRWNDLHEYLTADLIVATGGTYLVENYNIESRLFDFELSLRLRRPLALFTQSLGPFDNKANRDRLRPIFENSLITLLRDERSRRNVTSLGVDPSKTVVCADAAFSMAKSETLKSAAARDFPTDSPLRIGISVRNWSFFKQVDTDTGMARYREAVGALVCDLVQNGNEVTFISTCQGIPAYWTDDSKLAESIAAELPPAIQEALTIDRSFRTPQALATRLGELDLVIATRMHMAILSLVAGTPVLPIAYEFKTSELFERLGVAEWVVDIETLTPQSLAADFERVRPVGSNSTRASATNPASEKLTLIEPLFKTIRSTVSKSQSKRPTRQCLVTRMDLGLLFQRIQPVFT